MKLNYFTKQVAKQLTKQVVIATKLVATTMLCLAAIAFVWQGAFLPTASTNAALAGNL